MCRFRHILRCSHRSATFKLSDDGFMTISISDRQFTAFGVHCFSWSGFSVTNEYLMMLPRDSGSMRGRLDFVRLSIRCIRPGKCMVDGVYWAGVGYLASLAA